MSDKAVRPGTFVWVPETCDNECEPRKWHVVSFNGGSYVLSCRSCGTRTRAKKEDIRVLDNVNVEDVV